MGSGTAILLLQVPAAAVCVILAGQLSDGFVLSVMMTANEHVHVLPAASLILYVMVVVPTLKVCVPTKLIPVAGELNVVAPVIFQVREAIEQLS